MAGWIVAKNFLDRVMLACETGKPWDMARASYAYSRAHGLTVREALAGAINIYLDYRKRKTP